MNYRWKMITAKLAMQIALLCFVVFLAFPLVWMLSTSLKPSPEIYSRVPTLIPKEPTLANYRVAFGQQDLLTGISNSFKIGVFSTIAVLILTVPAAYALVRYKTALNKSVMAWVLVSQLFPSILIIIPLFVVLRNLALTNSHVGITLVYTVWSVPFVLWMLRSYVMSIPIELEEAAYIDGATRLQRIWHVTLSQIRPTISIMLIMQLGKIISIDFDRPYMLGNTLVKSASDVISTYVYNVGLQSGRFDFATAVGLFQSVVGIILILSVNQISKKIGEEGIM
jgi:ABC-type glycerol-3-phosphate transport system permease component